MQKLILLARAAFGVELRSEEIERCGIDWLNTDAVRSAAANGKRLRLLENSNVNGKKVLESFPKADADRFVAAFRARKNRGQ